ncbi:MAG: thiolase family protein [Lachnospiraceae bacterium]|nr:thiolase family protein [Lachnospiraceae bacterium]MBR5739168.1 thiolase family protein [Lachnospiraceae bacterium]
MRNVVLVDGVRTGFGKIGGTLKQFSMTDLAAFAVNGLLKKTQILERGGKVEGLYMGGAFYDAETQAPARYTVLKSNLPIDVWTDFIERQCGSGIECINQAAANIMVGNADIMIAGGSESFSRVTAKLSMSTEPYKLTPPTVHWPQKLSPVPEDNLDMITTAERVAQMFGVTREDCDEFACRSQHRAAAAWEKGYFDEEIVPVTIPATRKTPEVIFAKDEFMRPDTSMEGLAALKPVKPNGVVTAGNASGRNDGGSMVLMMTEEKAKELGYEPYARFVQAGNSALDPKIMGLGPVSASLDALKRAGLTMDDIDLWECNEAFAAQNLGVIRSLEQETGKKIDIEKWNVNGGAISFGHPNGASGPRIAMFTMRELERRGGRYGLFTSCCGGGLGVTTIIENLRR